MQAGDYMQSNCPPYNVCNHVSHGGVHKDIGGDDCKNKFARSKLKSLFTFRMHIFTNVYFHCLPFARHIYNMSSVPWDAIGEVDCPNKFRLAPCSYTYSADKWIAILIVGLHFVLLCFFLTLYFLNLRIVIWIIVEVFWFSEGTPPWGMSKLGSLRFSFSSNPTPKYPFKEYRPHCPESCVLWIWLSESQGAA